ncbi:MAG: cytochrome c, class I [Candidatus Parabeggiatoa sp. nov. 1]|nr:MAG: cytochrome c, class I [Gammaproteobacteria bacterium]HEC84450.1 c-type cytochrome [Thioploca sp.]
MKQTLSGLIVASMLASALTVNAAERSASLLSNACAGCHGTAGASAGDSIPILAGLPSEYFRRTMQRFKSGERYSTIMGRIARGYSDAEIDAMATFFEEQEWLAASHKRDPKMIAKGKKLHKKKCARCHLGDGGYTEYRLPRIAGQWADYLLIYMKNATTSEFKQPQPQLMKKSLEGLTESELAALAHFYAAQQ